MDQEFTIAALRRERGETLEQFAAAIGLASKGNASIIERGGACSLNAALAIERLSAGRIDAAKLNEDVAAARQPKSASAKEPVTADELMPMGASAEAKAA